MRRFCLYNFWNNSTIKYCTNCPHIIVNIFLHTSCKFWTCTSRCSIMFSFRTHRTALRVITFRFVFTLIVLNQLSIIICISLGFLIDFVSTPVVAGFTSAGAVTIASAQVKNLIGLKFSAESFVEIWINVVDNIKEIQKWDAILSFLCCFVLLFLRVRI